MNVSAINTFTMPSNAKCAYIDICFHLIKYGEGNGNAFQYTCLENPMD